MSRLIMMVGLPGSGKSTIAQQNYPEAVYISSDAIREEMFGNANEQKNPSEVFREMLIRTHEALNDGMDVVYDATNLEWRKRRALVTEVKKMHYGIVCECVIVLCSITECKRRQLSRDRKVPDHVIDRMARQFHVPYYNEGWDSIILCENGPMQDIDKEHTRLRETMHDNPHHSTGNIGAHCTAAYAAMQELIGDLPEEDPQVVLFKKIMLEAAYQHDIGKRKTKVFHDAKGNPTDEAHYYGHENIGAYLWLTGDKRNEWDGYAFLVIAVLIQLHMKPYSFPNRSEAELTTWCKRAGFTEEFAQWIWLLHRADEGAH